MAAAAGATDDDDGLVGWTVDPTVVPGLHRAVATIGSDEGTFGLLFGSFALKQVVAWVVVHPGELDNLEALEASLYTTVNPALTAVGIWGATGGGARFSLAADLCTVARRRGGSAVPLLGCTIVDGVVQWSCSLHDGAALSALPSSPTEARARFSTVHTLTTTMDIAVRHTGRNEGLAEGWRDGVAAQADEIARLPALKHARVLCAASGAFFDLEHLPIGVGCAQAMSGRGNGPTRRGGGDGKGQGGTTKKKGGGGGGGGGGRLDDFGAAAVPAGPVALSFALLQPAADAGLPPPKIAMVPADGYLCTHRVVVEVAARPLLGETASAVLTGIARVSHPHMVRVVADRLVRELEASPAAPTLPRAFQFEPHGFPTVVSAVWGGDGGDEPGARDALHRRLGLPPDRPLFRRSMSLAARAARLAAEGDRLCNPHLAAKPAGVAGGKQFMTEGLYLYYHYMQDRFDDNGWGCAYRSFQTIVSWFVLQGYAAVEVPGHRKIQELCVANGVRQKEFVGSKEWIGSMEVGWLLQWTLAEAFELDNKYMTGVQGADLAAKGREFALHFETHGTPIMIGGNNLAHTILGVDYNEQSGAIKWLVLDPHYTGADNLKTVVEKGWCAWKGPEFWKPNVPYNLCLPLRPAMV